jgi:hypothetical protein
MSNDTRHWARPTFGAGDLVSRRYAETPNPPSSEDRRNPPRPIPSHLTVAVKLERRNEQNLDGNEIMEAGRKGPYYPVRAEIGMRFERLPIDPHLPRLDLSPSSGGGASGREHRPHSTGKLFRRRKLALEIRLEPGLKVVFRHTPRVRLGIQRKLHVQVVLLREDDKDGRPVVGSPILFM